MKTIITASLLLATAALTACATDDGALGDEMDIEIRSADGKADSISGKRLRFRTRDQVSPWYDNGDARLDAVADLTKVKSVSVDVATESTAVVSGDVFIFSGTDGTSIDGKPWFGNQLLTLSVDGAPGARTAAALGFVVVDGNGKTLACVNGSTTINFFQELAIDITSREVHVDSSKTFTFTECGLSKEGVEVAGHRSWDLATIVVPLETEGALKGKYNYKLNAEAI